MTLEEIREAVRFRLADNIMWPRPDWFESHKEAVTADYVAIHNTAFEKAARFIDAASPELAARLRDEKLPPVRFSGHGRDIIPTAVRDGKIKETR